METKKKDTGARFGRCEEAMVEIVLFCHKPVIQISLCLDEWKDLC